MRVPPGETVVNPLLDVASAGRRVGVMARGRWLPEAELRQRLAQAAP